MNINEQWHIFRKYESECNDADPKHSRPVIIWRKGQICPSCLEKFMCDSVANLETSIDSLAEDVAKLIRKGF